MRPSLRFLALAVVGWAGMRAATLGSLPGAELFRIDRSEAKPPPIVPTQFPPVERVAPATTIAAPAESAAPPISMAAAAPTVRYVQAVVGVPVPMARGVVPVYRLPAATPAHALSPRPAAYAEPPEPAYYSQLPAIDGWPMTRLSAVSLPHSVVVPQQSMPAAPAPPIAPKLDRLQLSSWALLRSQQSGVAGSRSLASGGQLGASQAGARLNYNLNRQIAVSARTSTEVGRRGGEVAAGVRVQPLVSIPVWLTAERRQAIGKYGGGRSAFAFFLEGGLYERPLPWRFTFDTYFQGGIVGLNSRDLFADGALTVSRPVYRQFSAGFGIWGGAQPGLYRVDAGPRLTMRVRNNLKVHVDWRQKLAGNARPGSGPVLTLAGDF
ncbi:MAG TPA: hypothetical protein VJT70_02015 [Sphingomicrobium sp.]|nr:hypothetical protein [Sphingomicrobium sp.]